MGWHAWLLEEAPGIEYRLLSQADDLLEVLVPAARSVAEGEVIGFCVEHNATFLATDRDTQEQVCWKRYMNFIPSAVPYSPCRMVEKILADPT